MDISLARLEAGQLAPLPAKPESTGAKDLEQLFGTFVVKELRRSLPNGFFGKGAGADVYEGWLEEHLGRSLAESGALDLAGSIKASLDSKQRIREGESELASKPRSAETERP